MIKRPSERKERTVCLVLFYGGEMRKMSEKIGGIVEKYIERVSACTWPVYILTASASEAEKRKNSIVAQVFVEYIIAKERIEIEDPERILVNIARCKVI